MKPSTLILQATIEESAIHGALIAPTGERRVFYGWLEFNTAVEAALGHSAGTPDLQPTGTPADQLKRK